VLCQPIATACGGQFPPQDAFQFSGQWAGPWNWAQGVPHPCGSTPALEFAHAALLATGPYRGRVLLWDGEFNLTTTTAMVWDPNQPGTLTCLPQQLASHIFCAGVSARPDGTLTVAGGVPAPAPTPDKSYVFDPVQAPPSGTPWSGPFQMIQGRFYPTVITLSSAYLDTPLCLGGTGTPLVSGPGFPQWEMQWQWSTGGPWSQAEPPGSTLLFDWYPRMFELSTGEVFVAGDVHPSYNDGGFNTPGGSWLLAPPTTQGPTGTWVAATPDGTDRYYGTAIIRHCLPQNGGLDRVLVFGGSSGCNPIPQGASCSNPPVVTTEVKEYQRSAGAGGTWWTKTPMNCPRVHLNAVILPTGEILLVGGATEDHTNGWNQGPMSDQEVVIYPELYDPGTSPSATGTTRYVAANNPPHTPRVYHSVAVLLPDGRVLVAGGEEFSLPSPLAGRPSKWSGEVYSPPYLFQGPQPLLDSGVPAPLNFSAGTPNTFQLAVKYPQQNPPAFIDRVVLLRPAAVTHHFDADQRYIELGFTEGSHVGTQSTLTITAPQANVGPRGWYMLFAVLDDGNGNRIPSQGVFVQLQ
jgi:hypothetical protein